MVNNKTIDAKILSRMFLSGAKNLEAKKEWINELNVFPVPDGDTGTNMTLTIMSAASEVGALTDPDMESLAKAISSGSLRGARGNSGVILSQLLRGFTRGVRKLTDLDAPAIAAAMERGVETAYKAVMKPKEGTILTVARAAADRAAELADAAEDLDAFFDGIFQHAEETLARTPEMLPVLKEAGVVDSGGHIMEKKWIIPSLKQQLLRSQRFLLRQRQISNLDIVQSLLSFLKNRFHRMRSTVSVNFWIPSVIPLFW